MTALLADLWHLFARRRDVTTGVIPGGPAPGSSYDREPPSTTGEATHQGFVHAGQLRRARKGDAGAS